MPRRKPGTLVDLEVAILAAGIDLTREGSPRFHGYLLARHIAEREGARRLTAHGTLYKALGRMEASGLLESEWEDSADAAAAERPRRRLYRVTVEGERALARADAARDNGTAKAPRVGLEPA